MQPIIPANKAPERAAGRNIRFRYPWLSLKPGESFEFSPNVKILSARVMCSNMGQQEGLRFECFRGTDNKLYARRVDGIPLVDPPLNQPLPMAPIHAEPPERAEVYGVFGHRAPDNIKNLRTEHISTLKNQPYPAGIDVFNEEPIDTSQARADAINKQREENLAKLGDDDVI